MTNPASNSQLRRMLRSLAPTNKRPASGTKAKAKYSGRVPLLLFREAEPEGTLIVSVDGAGEGPGVIVAGAKLQVAPGGNELCRQESVIVGPGALGLSVIE